MVVKDQKVVKLVILSSTLLLLRLVKQHICVAMVMSW